MDKVLFKSDDHQNDELFKDEKTNETKEKINIQSRSTEKETNRKKVIIESQKRKKERKKVLGISNISRLKKRAIYYCKDNNNNKNLEYLKARTQTLKFHKINATLFTRPTLLQIWSFRFPKVNPPILASEIVKRSVG